MLIDQRQTQILDIIKEKEFVSVEALTKLVFASPATIRRDLIVLEKLGLIRKVRGGATLVSGGTNVLNSSLRKQFSVSEKHIICSLSKPYIQDEKSYFFDSSTTVGSILSNLNKSNGVVAITNGLENQMILSQLHNVDVHTIGGDIHHQTNSIIGSYACKEISKFYCDVMFFSCHGLTIDGPGESSSELANVKTTMLARSKVHILLVDHTKFNRPYFANSCSFNDIDIIISDEKAPDELLEKFKEFNIRFIYE